MMNKIDSYASAPRRAWARALLCALFFAAAARSAHAAFDALPVGAQAAAMGGAGLAGRGDSAALFLNPAGVAGLKRPEAYSMYNRFYAGLSGVGGLGQGFAALGVPTKLGILGVGYGDLRASGLLEERVIGVAFARRWFDAFEAGVTGKYLYHRYLIGADPSAASDPVFRNGAARGAFALDLGLSAAVAGPLTAGLAVRNINRPDVGLASPDPIPREVQASLSYAVESWGLRLTADYHYRDAGSGSPRERSVPGVGIEKSLEGELVKFRVGATPDQFSGGAGLQFDRLGFDYAFTLSRNLLADNAGTHKLGIRYRFGDAAPSVPRNN